MIFMNAIVLLDTNVPDDPLKYQNQFKYMSAMGNICINLLVAMFLSLIH